MEVSTRRAVVFLVTVASLGWATTGVAAVADPPRYPGIDTLGWCEYNSNGSGNTITGYLAGYGVKLKPSHYPAFVSGIYHRVFQLNTNKAQIRVIDDDGLAGSPGTRLYKHDTTLTAYSGGFVFHPLPAPYCTIYDGSFYLFVLGRDSSTATLNWLHDGSRSAPDSTFWRFDGIAAYSLFQPGGDVQMCAVVDYHDVAVDSFGGLTDTVFIESTYTVRARCAELAGFPEPGLRVVMAIGSVQFDTATIDLAANDTAFATFAAWQPRVTPGDYDCACYSTLFADTRRQNDTVRFRLTVATSSGVGERQTPYAQRQTPSPTIVRGVLRLRPSPFPLPVGEGQEVREWNLLDASGRKVADLHAGANDVRDLAPGVYFVRQQPAVGSRYAAANVRKVIVTR